MPSMKQYLADRNRQGLHWPGTADGYPFRGPVPDLRGDEYEEHVRLVGDFFSRRFCLWVEQEHAEFNTIMDMIVNGRYVEYKRYDRWCDQHSGLVVWLEWVEIIGESQYARNTGIDNGQTIQHPAAGVPAPGSYDIPGPQDSPTLAGTGGITGWP